VTCADDLVILCRRSKAEAALQSLREIMDKLRRRGCGNGATAEPLTHRQTKGAGTDIPSLTLPRHTPTFMRVLPFEGGDPSLRAGVRHG
jgi:hypothetical protein